ncbi:Flavin prenyltransferase UbiX [hydrothermal vent metagenome]|uniref:flavin prenyltransferase n=1 Tax=hydrothermal vent metagenome TaxID=652676 RepID=A0A3B1AEC0_9ZZZZ
MNDKNEITVTLAFTGASGAAYGLRLLECLLKANCHVNLVISKAGQMVLAMESELTIPSRPQDAQQFFTKHFNAAPDLLNVYGRDDWMAPMASGTGCSDAMVICPCTAGSLSAVAQGASDNLIERAADVTIKEHNKLILLVRETPLSAIHLENMLKLARLGVVIMPANPGFYQKPASVNDLVDFMVARILDHLDIQHKLLPRWGE